MRIALCSALAMLAALGAVAQEELTRQLWNSEFIGKRPAGTGAPAKPPSYRRTTPVSPQTASPPPAGEGTILGLTLWRVRPPRPADAAGTRLLVLEPTGGGAGEQVPERLSADTVLAEGDRVRLSVEAATSGYLYIIDREKYADGSLSDPYVIYPNRLTRIDGNRVSPGRLIEIPDREDHPNVFTIRSSRPQQSAEVLSLLITTQPLAEVKIGSQPFRLDTSVYKEWEKQWAAKAERFELEGGAGQAWTPQEKQAGAGQDGALTQSDPTPQSLYRVSAPPGSPVILEIPLQFKK
jgi:hypothetical protein